MRIKGMEKNGRRMKIDVVKINVFLIVPEAQRIVPVKVQMHPRAIQDITGKMNLAFGKLGIRGAVEIGLAADKTPQIGLLTDIPMEASYIVNDENGDPGPLLHGKGLIFGFLTEHKKACSAPVDINWVKQHVIWKSGMVDPDRSAKIQSRERLESERGEDGEAPQS